MVSAEAPCKGALGPGPAPENTSAVEVAPEPAPETPPSADEAAPGMVVCPTCRDEGPMGRFCRSCGAPLARFCTGCGSDLAGALTCGSCGKSLETYSTTAAPMPSIVTPHAARKWRNAPR